MVQYEIFNSDIYLKAGIKGATERGMIITLKEQIEACTWGESREKVIPAGTYKIVNRKRFRKGCVTIEPV